MKTHHPALLCLLLLACAACGRASAQSAPAHVEFFSPQGTMRAVRQVQVRFDQDMVALGDPRLPDPFEVRCDAPGHGRWADGRNWEYDFDADLDAGVQCRFTLRGALTTLSGAALAGQRTFTFDTGGPAIVDSLPGEGAEDVDESQAFILKLDAPASAPTVAAHAWCAIEGIGERVPVQVLQGAARAQLLAQSRQLAYAYYELLWKNGTTSDVRVRNRELARREALLTVVRCQRRLPAASPVTLHWGAGIASLTGIATTADQPLAFKVRPSFTAQVGCTRTNPRAGCVPTLPVEVTFSAPVARTLALGVRLVTPDGTVLEPDVVTGAAGPSLEGVTFQGPFPAGRALSVRLPAGLIDDAGRTLVNAARFPLTLRIGSAPPLVKFSGEFGVLESGEGGVLPVTVRNVEARVAARMARLPASVFRVDTDAPSILGWLRRVTASQQPRGEWRESGDPTAGHPHRIWTETTGDTSVFAAGERTAAFAITPPSSPGPLQVIGIPLRKPGLYVVEIASPALGAALLGPGQVRHVATAALVTNLAVHLQWGRESSVAWVTQLDSGRPVPGARVLIADSCSGTTLWQGATDAQGIARVTGALGLYPHGGDQCRWQHGLIALARTGEDMGFTLSAWSQGITPPDFSLPMAYQQPGNLYHTVFDRELFHAGETVSMKHFIRQHVLAGLRVPGDGRGTLQLQITHEGSGEQHTQEVRFDAGGSAVSSFAIPADARLGTYEVAIAGHPSGAFTVAQFRLPSMRGAINGPAHTLVGATAVTLDLHVAYLSGGGAAGLPVKVRSLLEPRTLAFEAWPDYTFGGDPVVPGLRTSTDTATTGDDADEDADADGSDPGPGAARTQTLPLTLDASGSGRITLGHLPQTDHPARLAAELEYSDANGQTYTASTHVDIAPAPLALGLRTEGWIGTAGQLRLRVLAVDLDGRPLSGRAIRVNLYQSATYSYRKRLMGGFYAYETATDVRQLSPECTGVTDPQGVLACELAPGVSGQILVRAQTTAGGITTGATTTMWCLGADELWFGGTSGDRMDLLPERPEYTSGETARFQVRMPFREATALVSVEREGVIRSFVTTLHGNAPIVAVPVEAVDAPNVYVSVLAVRGRVAHAGPGGAPDTAAEVTALVDLNRPAYRLGVAQIRVDWKPHRLRVQVEPDASVLKVRGNARVHIHVGTDDGTALPAGTEVAVAAVDEALLDLKPNDSWDLLAAMMQQRPLEVWTSTAQMQVVGKRHYGRKAVPHGGGGGRQADSARELFDSLLTWQARVRVDEHGDATVQVPLNDSLSTFRIVAVAHGGEQHFGTGSATVRTTQDLILLSGLPPVVREGDRYTATFTVRNTTDRAIAATVQATSAALGGAPLVRSLRVPAGLSTEVHLAAVAPVAGAAADAHASIAWRVAVTTQAGDAGDALKATQELLAAVPVRTYQATLAQLVQPLVVPAALPTGALAGRGGLSVSLQPHLAGALDGVREYLQRYPYDCLEQLTSRSIVLDDRAQWDAVMARLPRYMDGDGLLRYFPSESLPGDDTLTAYVVAIGNARGWPVPPPSQARLAQALKDFVAGRLVRYSALPTADLTIRKLAAIEALARLGQATPDMLDSLAVQPQLLPTSALLDWIGILQRLPPQSGSEAKVAQAFGILRARLNFQGTVLTFATTREDALWWLMVSEDSNANRMLIAAMTRPEWTADMPRLVRGALGRQQFGHWNTTVANAWGVIAMADFSARFETVPVTGTTRIDYAGTPREIAWDDAAAPRAVELRWAGGTHDLHVAQSGTGAPWVMIRARAALPLAHALSTGFRITRTVTAIDPQHPGRLTRGDVLRVHLDLDAQSDMSWVVVEDPVPGGATLLGGGLGGDSALLTLGSRDGGAAWLAFQESRFDSFRAYYRFVPKGRWSLEYTLRLDNPGTFSLPPTRVEAMYAPEMLGALPNAAVTVTAAP